MTAREHHVVTIRVQLAGSVKAYDIVGPNRARVANAGDRALGIAMEPGVSGDFITVVTDGIQPVRASAAIAQFAPIQAETSGKAKTLASNKHVVGIALEAASADGDLIPVLLRVGAHT